MSWQNSPKLTTPISWATMAIRRTKLDSSFLSNFAQEDLSSNSLQRRYLSLRSWHSIDNFSTLWLTSTNLVTLYSYRQTTSRSQAWQFTTRLEWRAEDCWFRTCSWCADSNDQRRLYSFVCRSLGVEIRAIWPEMRRVECRFASLRDVSGKGNVCSRKNKGSAASRNLKV